MDKLKQEAYARALMGTGVNHPLTGKPIYIDPEGYPETEKSVTVNDPRMNNGAWTNLPTVWSGQQMPDEQWAVNNALISGQSFPSYPSLEDAETAAVQRSKMLGATMPNLPGMDPNTGRLSQMLLNRMWQRGY